MGFLATDVGGTFTDLVHFDPASGRVTIAKTLTTPDDPSSGVMNAIANGQQTAGYESGEIRRFVHGGTTVINAITERKGGRTALVTTAGFRDVIEIGRGNRPDLYNLHASSPEPFVPRYLRFEVTERMDTSGQVVVPLDTASLEAIALECEREEVEAVAVVFLNSYVNPEHEIACEQVLARRLPGVAVTSSHRISRQWREYERSNTAVLNAFVMPVVDRYFARLQAALEQEGFRGPFFAMQSNGGMAGFASVRAHPLSLVESGPAGGVSGAAAVGALLGEPDLLYLDVGGTTAKCSVIRRGKPVLVSEYRLDRTRTHAGYPLQVPVVDIVEIGAGGGSIAWFDERNALRVGPRSAGSAPGPACYGLGGLQPTVTDAKLVTGVLDAASFAGGSMRLDMTAAERALQPVADRLGTDVAGAAAAVIRIAEASMLNALKLVTIQRGHDPRDLVLVASGGGGPMHAAVLARELGMRRVVIPRAPGVFSAWGMLVSAPRRDLRRTEMQAADAKAIARGRELFREMQAEAADYFATRADDLECHCAMEMRYRGQEHTVSVPCDLETWDVVAMLEAFHRAHEEAYTFRLNDARVEVVSFHLQAELETERPTRSTFAGEVDPAPGQRSRLVDFGDAGRHVAARYWRDALEPGFRTEGPAVIEEVSSTTVVLSGQVVEVDDHGLLSVWEAA